MREPRYLNVELTSCSSNNIQSKSPGGDNVALSIHIPGANNKRQQQRNAYNTGEAVARPVIDKSKRKLSFQRVGFAIVKVFMHPTLPCNSDSVVRMPV
jgi:hypothetical protein